jgi:hypothetical protein
MEEESKLLDKDIADSDRKIDEYKRKKKDLSK